MDADITQEVDEKKVQILTVGKNSKHYAVKKLWSNQKEILRLLASGLYSPKQIADIVGVNVHTIYRLSKSEMGKQYIEMIEGAGDAEALEINSRLKQLAPIALSIQEDILFDESNPTLQNKIADKILDRAGHVPVTKNITGVVSAGLTRSDIAGLKEKAKALREGLLVKEVEATTVEEDVVVVEKENIE